MIKLDPQTIKIPDLPDAPVGSFFENNKLDHMLNVDGDGTLDDNQPYDKTEGVRLHFNTDFFEGRLDLVRLGEESFFLIEEYNSKKKRVVRSALDDCVSLHFRLAGDSIELFGENGQLKREGPVCTLVVYPHGFERTSVVAPDTRIRSFGLFLKSSEFAAITGLPLDFAMTAIGASEGGPSEAFGIELLPISITMMELISSIEHCEFSGKIRHAYIKAKVVELFCVALAELPQARLFREEPVIRLTAKEKTKLEEIRSLLESNLAAPPPVKTLTKDFGLNRNKLAYGFKSLYGESVSGYCHKMRMKKALHLLQHDRMAVSDVAYALGYAYPQNFTASFKQYYGVYPNAVRW